MAVVLYKVLAQAELFCLFSRFTEVNCMSTGIPSWCRPSLPRKPAHPTEAVGGRSDWPAAIIEKVLRPLE